MTLMKMESNISCAFEVQRLAVSLQMTCKFTAYDKKIIQMTPIKLQRCKVQ